MESYMRGKIRAFGHKCEECVYYNVLHCDNPNLRGSKSKEIVIHWRLKGASKMMDKYRTWFTDPYDGNRRVKQITFMADGHDDAVRKATALHKQYDDENDTVTEMNMIYVRERSKQ